MNERTDHWLVVLDAERLEAARAELDAFGRVTQSASARVLELGELGDRCAEDLAAVDGVLAITSDSLPPEVQDQLDVKENLWASAWALRQQPKNRKGEGLDWDAEGFEPP